MNESLIECPKGRAGGIVGTWWSAKTISNCANKGEIRSGQYAGGITSSIVDTNGGVFASYNTGNITGVNNVGGICGNLWNKYGQPERISNCYNTGNITGTSCVGGIIGSGSCQQILYSYNTGKVSGTSSIGGFIGQLNWGAEYTRIGKLMGCYSIGTVESTSTTDIGGFIGKIKTGLLEKCYYLDSGSMYGYTSVLNSVTPDYEQANVTEADFYNKEFLNTLGFKEFVSEEDLQENSHNVWIINGVNNPTLWWEN